MRYEFLINGVFVYGTEDRCAPFEAVSDAVRRVLAGDPGLQLRVILDVWGRNGIAADCPETLEDFAMTLTETVNPGALDTVAGWVADVFDDLIGNLGDHGREMHTDGWYMQVRRCGRW